jgi:hypothetical protein
MSSPCLATAWIRSTLTTSPNRLPSSLAHAAEACYLGHKHQECGLWLCPLATEPSGSVLPTDATEANLGQPENPMSTNSHLGATAYPEDVCMIALQTVCTDAEVSAALTRDENKFDEATRKADRELVLNFVHGIMQDNPGAPFPGETALSRLVRECPNKRLRVAYYREAIRYYCELETIRRCAAEPITLEDLHARLINLKNGDGNELKRLAKLIVSDYVLALQMLEAVDLVIRQPRPNGKLLLQWPQPDHPAVATLLATIEEDVAGKGLSAISKPSLHS